MCQSCYILIDITVSLVPIHGIYLCMVSEDEYRNLRVCVLCVCILIRYIMVKHDLSFDDCTESVSLRLRLCVDLFLYPWTEGGVVEGVVHVSDFMLKLRHDLLSPGLTFSLLWTLMVSSQTVRRAEKFACGGRGSGT